MGLELSLRAARALRGVEDDVLAGLAAVADEVHLGVEDPFRPARKAHPALLLDDVTVLDDAAARLLDLGFEVDVTERTTFPGHLRCHAFDGHGNRVELLA